MNSLPIIIAVLTGSAIYILGMLIMPRVLADNVTGFTRKYIKDLENDAIKNDPQDDENLMRDRKTAKSLWAKIYYSLPFGEYSHPYLVSGGIADKVDRLFFVFVGVFIASAMLLPMTGFINNKVSIALLSIFITYFIAWKVIGGAIKKRIRKFTDQFPDALDIIVRSVKSGFPINAAVNMVAESMSSPISEEFKQVSTEVAHGSTLVEALERLGQRMKTPDVNFFVVTLSLQQEVGGSLAEVLGNLSALIRKRKTMVRKIQAITSEGRFTGWVLGALPVLVAGAIQFMEPKYLLPLFSTQTGHTILAFTVGTIATGIFIIRRMVDMEI